MWEHWQLTQGLRRPLLCEPRLSEALERTLQGMQDLGSDIAVFRASAVSAVRSMRERVHASTAEWYKSLPSHVASAYTYDHGKQIVQIPLFMTLL